MSCGSSPGIICGLPSGVGQVTIGFWGVAIMAGAPCPGTTGQLGCGAGAGAALGHIGRAWALDGGGIDGNAVGCVVPRCGGC